MKTNLKTTSEERAFSIVYRPLMTEKSTNLNQYNQYLSNTIWTTKQNPNTPKSQMWG